MIILGTIQINHSRSFIEARNKIRVLAELLADDSITPTRLAIATSQICRSLQGKNAPSFIRVHMDDGYNQSAERIKKTQVARNQADWILNECIQMLKSVQDTTSEQVTD